MRTARQHRFAGAGPRIRAPQRRCKHSGSRGVVACATGVQLPRWEAMWSALRDSELKSVSPKTAEEMVASGEWVIVDVRPKEDFDQASPEGAVSVPLFQGIDFSNAGPSTWLRAAAYAVNGVKPIEFNPNFIAQVNERSDGRGVILMCEAGGTMKPSVNFLNGKTSRSLKAAYRVLTEASIPSNRIGHLDGGMYGWYLQKCPIRGTYGTENVGRTPNAAAEPTGLPESPVKIK